MPDESAPQEASSPTFGIQAAGSTPAPTGSVEEVSMIPEGQQESGEAANARLYADKYQSVDDLEKGYQELQTKFSEARPSTSDMAIDDILDAAGLKGEEVATNWREDGHLTDGQYEAFGRLGFSKALIDQYFSGQVAIAQNGEYAVERMERKAQEMAGGPEEWQSLMRWAGNNLPENQIDGLNERLQKPTEYEGAIKELLWDYKVATGRLGGSRELLSGEAVPNTTSGFTNVNELVQAMGKAREQGYMDESTKRRIANTSQTILQGVDG